MRNPDNVMFSSNSAEWATPQDFFDKLDNEFGFTLDVCATSENAKCDTYFTIEDDGLSQAWIPPMGGAVWCNPPYGKEISKWCAKAERECVEQWCTIVMLVHARTDTRWFHNYIYNRHEIRFVKGRLKFGGSANSAPFPSMVVVFRPTDTIGD